MADLSPLKDRFLKFRAVFNLAAAKKALHAFRVKLTPQASLDDQMIAAVKAGNLDAAKMLVADGAHAGGAADPAKSETLYIAAGRGDVPMISYLAGLGVPADTQHEYGRVTPMIAAIKSDSPEAVRTLAAALPASLEAAASAKNFTPLIHAAQFRFHAMAETLLDLGASLTARDRDGMTPLAHAAARGDEKMIGLLLARGADARAVDDEMNAVLDHAKESKNPAAYFMVRDHLDKTTPEWQKIDAQTVAHVSVCRPLGFRLTQIFSFGTGDLMTVKHNFNTGLDTSVTARIDTDSPRAAEAKAKLGA